MPIRSYVRSTDYYRKPCGENIVCGIDVSVVVGSTFWTIPFPNIKRQLIDNVTAVSTAFRAGKPSTSFLVKHKHYMVTKEVSNLLTKAPVNYPPIPPRPKSAGSLGGFR